MELLKQRILTEGMVVEGNILRVDSFINHQVDVLFMKQLAQAFRDHFAECQVTKILTIEASGIPIATLTALEFGVPLVFAKKTESRNLDENVYQASVVSYTRQRPYQIKVAQKFLSSKDRILIIDDFLAMGSAVTGLCRIVEEAGATLCGVGIVIEKGFQPGGNKLREAGIDVYSLAVVDELKEGLIKLR